MTTDHTPPQEGAPDPSMEDILASIRRILNEEDTKPADVEHPAHEPAHAPQPDFADVLELEPSMMLPEPDIDGPGPVPPPPPILAEPITAPAPIPAHMIEPPPPIAMPAPIPVAIPVAIPDPLPPSLVAPEAAAAAAVSVGALLRTLASERTTAVSRGGPTIEDLVREEMRPILKDWLDTHLAPMVERLVRAEIERVVSRMA